MKQPVIRSLLCLPPAELESNYCATPSCGQGLLVAGYQVLAEFGSMSSSRFGGSMLNTLAEATAAEWYTPDGYATPTNINLASWSSESYFVTDHAMQFFAAGSPSGALSHSIPSGTTQLVIAWGGLGNFECQLTVTDDSGTVLSKEHGPGGGTLNQMQVEVLSVDTTNVAGDVRLAEENGNICYIAYVLIKGDAVTMHQYGTRYLILLSYLMSSRHLLFAYLMSRHLISSYRTR